MYASRPTSLVEIIFSFMQKNRTWLCTTLVEIFFSFLLFYAKELNVITYLACVWANLACKSKKETTYPWLVDYPSLLLLSEGSACVVRHLWPACHRSCPQSTNKGSNKASVFRVVPRCRAHSSSRTCDRNLDDAATAGALRRRARPPASATCELPPATSVCYLRVAEQQQNRLDGKETLQRT